MTNTLDRILTDLSAHFGKTADQITVGTGQQMTTPKQPADQIAVGMPGPQMTMPKPVKPGLAAGVNSKRNRGGGTSRMMRGMFGANMLSNAVNTFSQNVGNAAGQVMSPVMR